MTVEDLIGDVVQIILREPGRLAELGFEKTNLFLKVVGTDAMGLWVEHPRYVVVRVNDEQGNPLPKDEHVHQDVAANFLIRWELIGTLVHFPNREGYDFPDPMEKPIGFVLPADDPPAPDA